jgi:hypothetical protein
MQIPISDAGGKLGNFADMRSDRVPARLPRQILRDGDERYEDDSRHQTGDRESDRIDSSACPRRFGYVVCQWGQHSAAS